MNSLRNAGKLLATLIFILSICAITNAQTSTFVSFTGSDANPGCPRATPCRNLQTAVNTVLPGGSVIVLDSAGYGTLAIAKSVTILAPSGVNAAINATSGTAVSITAGDVTLSGLQINGSGTATTGISVTTGVRVNLLNCVVTQFSEGLNATAGNIVARNSVFNFNSVRGVHASGTGKIDLVDCQVSFNGKGVTADGFGGCPQANTPTDPTTIVRLDGGIVSNSTTFAFEMLNVGAACQNGQAAHGQNIYLRIRATGSDFSTNFPGYFNVSTNLLFVQGQAAGAQILMGTYQLPNQGRQP
jgi:hypothetical protein